MSQNVTRFDRAPKCHHCGHFFDPSDERGIVPDTPSQRMGLRPECPLCFTMRCHGSEAWAVWNSCNGPFTHTLGSKERAAACLAESGRASAGDQVVPVRVYVEPEEQWGTRERQHRLSSI